MSIVSKSEVWRLYYDWGIEEKLNEFLDKDEMWVINRLMNDDMYADNIGRRKALNTVIPLINRAVEDGKLSEHIAELTKMALSETVLDDEDIEKAAKTDDWRYNAD